MDTRLTSPSSSNNNNNNNNFQSYLNNQNSISALLNNPLQKSLTQPYKIPKTLLPNVPQTTLAKVKPSDFQQYINDISPAFEPYRRNRSLGLSTVTQGIPTLARKGIETESPSYLNLWELTSQNTHSQLRNASSAPSLRTERERSLRFRNDAPASPSVLVPQPNTNEEPLERVPSIFFDPDFNLENPRTFETVVEQMNIVDSSKRENQVGTTNSLLQEKLSHYLDTVEVHLIGEVSRRSSSFFAALSTLQDLHKETLSCVEQIHSLRSNLAKVNSTQSKPGLNVIRLQRRRANLARLYSGARMIAEIRLTQPTIQILLGQGDFVGALDLIAEANRLLKGAQQHKPKIHAEARPDHQLRPENSDKSRNSVDLRGVRALLHLGGQLRDLHRMIDVMMENELVNALVADLTEFVAQLQSPTEKIATGSVAGTIASSCVSTQIDPIRERITPLLLGLLRTDRLPSALQAYRQGLMQEIKSAIKRRYPPVSQTLLAEDANAVGKKKDMSILARQLRAMTFDNFFSLLVSVYSVLLNLMRRISAIHDLFSSILRDAEARGLLPGSDAVSVIGFGDPPPSQNWQTPPHQNSLKPAATNLEIEEEDELESVPIQTRDAKPLPSAPLGGGSSSISSKDARKSTSNGTAYGQLISESSEICFSAADFAHVRCAKLVGVRADQNSQLNPKDFYRLFASTWEFVVEGEEMCGQMCFGLRGTMLSQAKSFLNHFHMERMKQLSLLIENEQWTQAEVPVDFQLIVDRICASAKAGSLTILCEEHHNSSPTTTPTASMSGGLNNTPTIADSNQTPNHFYRTSSFNQTSPSTPTIRQSNSLSSITSNMSRESGNSTKQLHVIQYTKDPQKVVTQLGYHAVGCSLMLVKMLEEYLICVAKVQAITTDAVGRLVEILRIFNSKTCQSVLGAGAMRSAGLKNITAKHIALAAQTLGLMMALIPHVRECMNSNMTAKQAVMLSEFDRMLRDFVEHQNELYHKLVSIMNDRLAIHCRSMQATNWDVPDPKQPPGAPSAWMELLVKESATLHKVLGKYLPVEALKFVMSNVFKSYAKRLEEEVQKVDVYTGAGKNRLLFDIQYYVRKLNDLEHIEGPGNNLEVAVNNLKIKEKSGRLSGLGGSRRPSSEETRGMRATPPHIGSTPGDHFLNSRGSISSLGPQQPSKQLTSSPPVSVNETISNSAVHHTQNSNPTPSVAPLPATTAIPPVSTSAATPAPNKPSAAGWSQRMVNMMNAKSKPATTNLAGSHDNLTDGSTSSLTTSPAPRGSFENTSVPAPRRSMENPPIPAMSTGNAKPAPVSAPHLQTPPRPSDPLSTEGGAVGVGVAGFLSGATSSLAGGMAKSALSNEAARKKLTEASSYLGKMFHRKDATSTSTPVPFTASASGPTTQPTTVNPSTQQGTNASVLQPSALPLESSSTAPDVPNPNVPTTVPFRSSLDASSNPHFPVTQLPTLPENGDPTPGSEIASPEASRTNKEELQSNREPISSLEGSTILDGRSEGNMREGEIRKQYLEHDRMPEGPVDHEGTIVSGTETGKGGKESASGNEELGLKVQDENENENEKDKTSDAPSDIQSRVDQDMEESKEMKVKETQERSPLSNDRESVEDQAPVSSKTDTKPGDQLESNLEVIGSNPTVSDHSVASMDVEEGFRIHESLNDSETEGKVDTEMGIPVLNTEPTDVEQRVGTVGTETAPLSPEREESGIPRNEVLEQLGRETREIVGNLEEEQGPVLPEKREEPQRQDEELLNPLENSMEDTKEASRILE